jgi:hypothetical protein
MVSSRWCRAVDRLYNFLTKNEDELQRYTICRLQRGSARALTQG